MPPIVATTTDSIQTTRARVVQAAVDCIREEGYYRASSNRIARRAGVSWGVIQHYFGSRESLMLEVVLDGAHKMTGSLQAAEIHGDTLRERVQSLVDVMRGHFARPEFFVGAQIFMDLSRDPTVAAETLSSLHRLSSTTHRDWKRLVDDVFPVEEQPPDFAMAIYLLVRNVAVGSELLDAITVSAAQAAAAPAALLEKSWDLLVDSLVAHAASA